MRRSGLLVAAIVLVAAGSASGYHLSVGADDTLLIAPTERPGDPSVGSGAFARATTRCPSDGWPVTDPSAGGADLLGGNRLCGLLRYEDGTTWQQISAKDQVLRWNIFSFDVVLSMDVSTYGLQTCLPWCGGVDSWDVARGLARDLVRGTPAEQPWALLDQELLPIVEPPNNRYPYDLLHGLLHFAGGPDEDEAWAGDQGWQRYAVSLSLPYHLRVFSNSDAWALPVGDTSFVAFLEDPDGVIGPKELEAIVKAAKSGGLLEGGNLAAICGYTRGTLDAGIHTTPGCQLPFRFVSERPTTPDRHFKDPCTSPAYLCGAVTPAWRATVTCGPVLGLCGAPNPPRDPTVSEQATVESTLWARAWHFVVAPYPSACDGLQEPGVDFRKPFFAHDVDIFRTPTIWGAGGWTVDNTWRISEPAREEAEMLADEAARPILREHRPEPNGGQLGPFQDTSRTKASIERSKDGCDDLQLRHDAVDDPWVDHLDARVVRDVAEPQDRALDLYVLDPLGAFEPGDGTDRSGPGQYFTQGRVGLFADVDDDGLTQQAPPGRLWQDAWTTGSYPAWWDLWLTNTGGLDRSGSCAPEVDDDAGLPVRMVEAGYGRRTGLLQFLYLREPSVWHHEPSGGLVQVADDSVVLLTSQAPRMLLNLTGNSVPDTAMTALLDQVLEALEAHATDLGAPAPRLAVPASVLDEQPNLRPPLSDFLPQCGEPTGGFTSEWSFTHACPPVGCAGDLLVTLYVYERTEVPPGNPRWIEPLPRTDFHGPPPGFHVWVDVDGFDG